ncbi:MAG: CoA-binding protein [Myxococcota bacterium]
MMDAGPVDVVSVFRKPCDVPGHLDGLLRARPPVVWFQSGLLHRPTAARLVHHSIRVAHACIACRRAAVDPATEPLW